MQNYIISTRLNKGLYQLIATESDKLNFPQSELVRIALRAYFDDRQKEDRIETLEKRLMEKMDSQAQRLEKLIQHVIAMAQS